MQPVRDEFSGDVAMAKKAKKAKKLLKQRKSQAMRWGAASGVLAGLAGDVLLKLASGMVEEYVQPHLKRGSKKKGAAGAEGTGGEAPDVAARVLRVLAERGPLTIPDLLTHAEARLVDLLHALQDVREFRLVEFVGDENRVQLTAVGDRTATVLSKQDIRREAEMLLGK